MWKGSLVFFTSARRLYFHHCLFVVVCLFVCLIVRRIIQQTTSPIFTKFGGKLAHGPHKKPLNFGVIQGYGYVGYHHTLHGRMFIRHLYNNNNFTSVTLVEVCTLLSAILVIS